MTRKMIYPKALLTGDTIAITAPSSGVEKHLHDRLKLSRQYLEQLGFRVEEGDTLWTNDKCVSASKEIRAAELVHFLQNPKVHGIIPPWGGEFLMDILPLIDWEALRSHSPKWIMGYSDISTFLFTYTLNTGIATAHGTNYMDLSAGEDHIDAVTRRWLDVLSTETGTEVDQSSSTLYQSRWDFSKPGLNLDAPTEWKCLGITPGSSEEISFSGRLIGGCLDTLSILVGTPYAPISTFVNDYCKESGVIWYLESCEMNAADLYRHLWQMKQSGWFALVKGFVFGRPAGFEANKNFGLADALHAALDDLHVPVIYDADIGHVPPQITLVNGALATVTYRNSQGKVSMKFD